MRTRVTIALLVVLGGPVSAQSDLQTTLLSMYTKTLDGMQKATTVADIERIVNAIDTPDWLSVNADGTRLTREQSKQELARSLASPRGDQPTFEILSFNQSGNAATAVCWVFVLMRRRYNELKTALKACAPTQPILNLNSAI